MIQGSSDFVSSVPPLGGFLFSYVAAVVIVGVGLLIGWAYQVSIPRSDHQVRETARVAPVPKPTAFRPEPELVFVGRVTDMVDCQWADPKNGTIGYASSPWAGSTSSPRD